MDLFNLNFQLQLAGRSRDDRATANVGQASQAPTSLPSSIITSLCYACPMQEAMEQLGFAVAVEASADLAGRSFGALNTLELVRVQPVGEGDGQHWELAWEADCIGDTKTIQLVVLPEFLEMEPELLVSQLSLMLTDRVLAEFQL